jgi:D,D-heptose 1,7-bisphosphate phosphatase
MYVKQAVFLVGGKGTRLKSLTQNTPKPLLEIAPDLRFLDVLLENASRQGFKDLILLAGHLGEQVIERYHGTSVYGAQVRVIKEPEPAGTGGALAFAHDVLDPWFVMANGDSLFDVNLRQLARDPNPDFMARLALRRVDDASRFGTVVLDRDTITGFFEKSTVSSGPALINGGIYLMSKAILDQISGPCSIETEIFPGLVSAGLLRGVEMAGYFLDIGLPDTYDQACREIPSRRRRPAVFFDRDGVLNHDEGYTHKIEDLVWMPGAKAAVRAVNEAGWLAIVVTNQAGIARGKYTEADMHRFHEAMQLSLSEEGAYIDTFYHCPYHQDGIVAEFTHPDHTDRKPNPGMINRALAEWPINAEKSFLIGDREHDVIAAQRAKIDGVLYQGGDLLGYIQPRVFNIDQHN